MKKLLSVFFTIFLFVTLTACGGNDPPVASDNGSRTSSSSEEWVALLYADFTQGNSEENVKIYEMPYTGDLTPDMLMDGLTEFTGLIFEADITSDDKGIWVDWDETSSLFTGPSDNQPEEFAFYDNVSFNWFIMDSLWTTLVKNYNAEVYYTMNGGLPFYLEYHDPIQTIPNDMPYQGSSFYYAHSDNIG